MRHLNKTSVKGALGGKGDRRTEIDDIMRHGKKTPGPGHFNPKLDPRIVGGLSYKGDRVSFLDECEYIGKEFPGAGQYKPNYKVVDPHFSTPMYKKAPAKKDWRPKKNNAPD